MRAKALVLFLGLTWLGSSLIGQPPPGPNPDYPPSGPQTLPPPGTPGYPPVFPGNPPASEQPGTGPLDQPSDVSSLPDNGADQGAAETVDPSTFYQPLAAYGEWSRDSRYGYTWAPAGMPAGWRPYTHGHWVYTDAGWAWVGDEPWAWAAYHYGRWYLDSTYGWRWVPGSEWAPAWVAWQEGDGYVGWAPLPPSVGFSFSAGLELGGVDLGVALTPWSYCFVAERDLLAPRVVDVALPAARNVSLVRETRNITHYAVVGHRVVDQGLAIRQAEQVTGRHIQPVRVSSATAQSAAPARESGGQIAFYRPRRSTPIARSTAATPEGRVVPPAPQRTETVDEMNRRHSQERSSLEQYQSQERERLTQIHQSESSSNRSSSPQVAERHSAEIQAQQQQHQREQQQLAARQEHERQAVQQRVNRPPANHEPPRPPSGR